MNILRPVGLYHHGTLDELDKYMFKSNVRRSEAKDVNHHPSLTNFRADTYCCFSLSVGAELPLLSAQSRSYS